MSNLWFNKYKENNRFIKGWVSCVMGSPFTKSP